MMISVIRLHLFSSFSFFITVNFQYSKDGQRLPDISCTLLARSVPRAYGIMAAGLSPSPDLYGLLHSQKLKSASLMRT